MKVVFDLDGVIRDIAGHIAREKKCHYPTVWDYSYNGKNIYECINENLNLLLTAPPTAYKAVMLAHFPHPEIWTNQPEAWRGNTMKWVTRHLGAGCIVYFMTTEEKEKKLKEKDNVILIEDSPNFGCYDNILLIDRPYNQGVRRAMRIYGALHFDNLLECIKSKEE